MRLHFVAAWDALFPKEKPMPLEGGEMPKEEIFDFEVISESISTLDDKAMEFVSNALPYAKIIEITSISQPEVDSYDDVFRTDGSDARRYVRSYSRWYSVRYYFEEPKIVG